MIKEFFQYKGISRGKLLTLVLEKYHLSPDLDIYSQKSQIALFEDLIYNYFIFNTDIDLKKLAKYYFTNKDYFYSSIANQSLLSIVLRWETEIGIALLKEIDNNRTINGKTLAWNNNTTVYDLNKWNRLYPEITFLMITNQIYFMDLSSEDYIENYLNLDHIPFNHLAVNHFNKFENLSLNNAKISNTSTLLWPEISHIVFDTISIEHSMIMGINFKNAMYAKTILLKKSTLFQGTLISPRDSINNINLHFKRPSLLELFKSFFTKNKYILFIDLELAQGTSIQSKELYDYYNWYTYYVVNKRGKNRLLSLFDLILTKYYTSISMVLFWSIIFIILYASIMYWLDQHDTYFTFKEGIKKDFQTYLFMSMTNFTTLGFGEIVANHWLSYLIVGIEVLTGYYMLAMLVAIASKNQMKYS